VGIVKHLLISIFRSVSICLLLVACCIFSKNRLLVVVCI